jgi:hypothetical protein
VTTVDLSNFQCLNDATKLHKLNRYVKNNTELMPHEIAGVLGCNPQEAMGILLFIFSRYLAEGYLLIYHKEHPSFPITIADFHQGFPRVPFYCDQCDQEILSKDELLYDFMFRLQPNLVFVTNNHALQ